MTPLVPADADLRDFPFTPVFRARLFGSSFHARANDSEWRAGVTLWLKSWDQTPAGSLPDDDIDLCRLAELGRDLKTWKKVKAGAMHGWQLADDGRLYHKVVAESVNEALERKAAQRDRTARARVAALKKRLSESTDEIVKQHITEEIERLSQSLLQSAKKSVTDDIPAPLLNPRDRDRDRDSKGTEIGTGTGTGINKPQDQKPLRPGKPVAPTAETWEAYATAYLARYGTDPVRNAKVNGQFANFLQRVSAEEAPHIAAFYVGHNSQFYVKKMHAVDCLLADAEKLRTEWFTRTTMTESQARQADRTQANGNVFGKLIAEAAHGD